VHAQTQAKQALRWLLARHKLRPPYKYPFGPRGLYWFVRMGFGPIDNAIRDELLERLQHFNQQLQAMDVRLTELRPQYPEVEVLAELYGVGLFSALVIVSEFGDVCRFRTAKKVGAYTGLTPRVNQSGNHCFIGHISKQGSPWLRWILVEAAVKIAQKDIGLANYHTRIRKLRAPRSRGWPRLASWQRSARNDCDVGIEHIWEATTAARSSRWERPVNYASGETYDPAPLL
jgi:transposase